MTKKHQLRSDRARAWRSGEDVDARRAGGRGLEAPAPQHGDAAVHLQVARGDAGRALRQGLDIGSVIPTKGAIIPAAVGVDIGCGMMAVRTSLTANDLPDSLGHVRAVLEKAVPHGRTATRGGRDKGAWQDLPNAADEAWAALKPGFEAIVAKHPKLAKANTAVHLGTLGTGNHFLEVCLDQEDRVWLMLHSGSRGVGNAIGTYFINLAKEEMRRYFINLPDADLAYLPEGTEHFGDYFPCRGMGADLRHDEPADHDGPCGGGAPRRDSKPRSRRDLEAVNCHHNYVAREHHFGENVLVTRKGAVRAAEGTMGIIPGSMGAKSFIVRGKGNAESFCSCSHGAGRVMSRTEAKRRVYRGRSRRGDGRRGVPQGRRRDRRDAARL